MEKKIVYFEDPKQDHTAETFALVRARLCNSGIRTLVLASTTGSTALAALEAFSDTGVRLVIVPHQFDFSRKGNAFPAETVHKLRQAGHEVHFSTMLFHTDKLYGNQVPTMIATFLRCFSQGVKVCVETVLMAADAGLAVAGEEVIAIAGTGKGADTALVMQAASTRHPSRLRVNEIICKPINRTQGDAWEE